MKSLIVTLATFLLPIIVLSAQPIHVISYNIRYDNPADGVNAWPIRKQKVYDLLKRQDPDILGVQEALINQMRDIESALKHYVWVGAGRDDGKEAGELSAILYRKDRFELIEEKTFWLSPTPDVPGSKGWDAAITRVATWAKLRDKKTGRELFIANTHFDHIGKEARHNSAGLLKKTVIELADGLPIIVTGDFNCKREDPPYAVLTDPSTGELIDPAPSNPPPTFCNFQVSNRDCVAIDYIFHSNDFSADRYQVISENDGTHYPSDHMPVSVYLDFQ